MSFIYYLQRQPIFLEKRESTKSKPSSFYLIYLYAHLLRLHITCTQSYCTLTRKSFYTVRLYSYSYCLIKYIIILIEQKFTSI